MGWLPMGSPLGGAFGKHNKKEKCNNSLKIKHFGSRIVFFRTLFGGVLEGVPGGPRESQRPQAPGPDSLRRHLKNPRFFMHTILSKSLKTLFLSIQIVHYKTRIRTPAPYLAGDPLFLATLTLQKQKQLPPPGHKAAR